MYYQYHIFFCLNKREANHICGCCASKNAEDLYNYCKQQLKQLGLWGAGKVRANKAGCMDRCKLGPVVVIYPHGIWYHISGKQDIDEIITQHIQRGKPISRLQLTDRQKRLVTG